MKDRGGLLWSGTSAKNDRHSVTWALDKEIYIATNSIQVKISCMNQWSFHESIFQIQVVTLFSNLWNIMLRVRKNILWKLL